MKPTIVNEINHVNSYCLGELLTFYLFICRRVETKSKTIGTLQILYSYVHNYVSSTKHTDMPYANERIKLQLIFFND